MNFPHQLPDCEIASPFRCSSVLSVVLELHFLSCQQLWWDKTEKGCDTHGWFEFSLKLIVFLRWTNIFCASWSISQGKNCQTEFSVHRICFHPLTRSVLEIAYEHQEWSISKCVTWIFTTRTTIFFVLEYSHSLFGKSCAGSWVEIFFISGEQAENGGESE